jgi:hypothetical protein
VNGGSTLIGILRRGLGIAARLAKIRSRRFRSLASFTAFPLIHDIDKVTSCPQNNPSAAVAEPFVVEISK